PPSAGRRGRTTRKTLSTGGGGRRIGDAVRSSVPYPAETPSSPGGPGGRPGEEGRGDEGRPGGPLFFLPPPARPLLRRHRLHLDRRLRLRRHLRLGRRQDSLQILPGEALP